MHLACHLNLNLQRDLCRSQMRPTYIYVNTFSKETYIHICKYICTYIYTANCIWSVSEYQSQKRPMWVSKETYIYICKYIYIHIYKRPTQETYKQTIAIGVSLNLNLQSLSHSSFFNRTLQKTPGELAQRLRFKKQDNIWNAVGCIFRLDI